MVISTLLEHSGHIRHEPEWSELLNVQPLMVFAALHGPQELLLVVIPLSTFEKGDLADVETPNHMDEVPPPV